MKWCIENATGAGRQVQDDYVPTVQETCKPMEQSAMALAMEQAVTPEPEPELEDEDEDEEE
tara:strand:+ start:2597 stop:2779 length:183 start_codon:yes stop_codon:yes gene_type:complete